MTARDLLPWIIAALGGGGVGTAIVALVKLRPEAGQIVVTAAQGALIIQTGVIDTLREEIDRLRDANGALWADVITLKAELRELRTRVDNGGGRP